MRKAIALIIGASIIVGSALWNTPAPATLVEFDPIIAIIAILIGDVSKSDVPPEQKAGLIKTIESWKSLPATKKNVTYIKTNSARITKLLATANNPSSRAALQKYVTGTAGPKSNASAVKIPTTKPTSARTAPLSGGVQQGKGLTTTTTTAPSVLSSPSLLSGSGSSGSATTAASKAKLPMSGATAPAR